MRLMNVICNTTNMMNKESWREQIKGTRRLGGESLTTMSSCRNRGRMSPRSNMDLANAQTANAVEIGEQATLETSVPEQTASDGIKGTTGRMCQSRWFAGGSRLNFGYKCGPLRDLFNPSTEACGDVPKSI
jgi:hypothetical protein